jgi:predicted lipoprotein with Yx(FWY)xxD motif
MKRIHTLVACALAAAASCAALAAAAPLGAQAATVQAAERMVAGKMRPILVTEGGFTLYMFTADKKHKDFCVTIMGCTSGWPPLEVTGIPTAGEGIKTKFLGTILLPDMSMQVTFKKHPLYTYIGDTKPGEVGYVGAFAFNGHWNALSPMGKIIK